MHWCAFCWDGHRVLRGVRYMDSQNMKSAFEEFRYVTGFILVVLLCYPTTAFEFGYKLAGA